MIVDGGKFDWLAQPEKFPTLAKPDPSYHGIVFAEAVGAAAYVTRIRAVLLRDTGATLSPFNAFILLQGVETLSLRVERHVENALKVVEFLKNHPKVSQVNHPALESHHDHASIRSTSRRAAVRSSPLRSRAVRRRHGASSMPCRFSRCWRTSPT